MKERDSNDLRTRQQIAKNVLKQTTNPLSYKEMVRIALFDLKQTEGTSPEAILNYICENYDVKNNAIASRRLAVALTKGVSDGAFRKS